VPVATAKIKAPHLLLIIWTAEFVRKGWAKRIGPIFLSCEEVAVRACLKVLIEVGFYVTGCWRSTRDFRPAAQASPNTPTKSYYNYNN
jgi:hypothetical protein